MKNPSIPGSVGFQGVGIWADGLAGQTAGVARPDPVPEPVSLSCPISRTSNNIQAGPISSIFSPEHRRIGSDICYGTNKKQERK